jgi:hypothetical protein
MINVSVYTFTCKKKKRSYTNSTLYSFWFGVASFDKKYFDFMEYVLDGYYFNVLTRIKEWDGKKV